MDYKKRDMNNKMEITIKFDKEEEEQEERDYTWFEGSDVTPSNLEDDAQILGEQ